jgi:hypothetical protein
MARYTSLYTVSLPVSQLKKVLYGVLESCNLKIIHDTDEYVMARETPGGVPFPKLVTVEVLIDRTTATDEKVHMKCVIKNEELPLQLDNHCRQMFESMGKAMSDCPDWKMIEAVNS